MITVTRGSGILEGFLAKKRASKANNLLKTTEKERILDLGCGSFPFFLTNTNFKEKHGIDPSLTSLKIKNLHLKKIDATKIRLPYEDNYFNAITMLAVFEHLDHDKLTGVLKELRRVLKKEGILVMTTPAPWADKLLHKMALMGLISKEEIHEHKHHESRENIINILKESGFRENMIKSGYFELGFNMWFSSQK